MAGFQPGDQKLTLEDTPFHLRLTIGALAEMDARLAVSGPRSLATRLRHLTLQDARIILECVTLGSASRQRIKNLSDQHIQAVLPDLCALFETAFSQAQEKSTS